MIRTLRQERLETVDFIHDERVAALSEAEAIAQRTVTAAMGEVRSLVDYVLLRLVLALGLGALLVALALWMATRPLVRTLQLLAERR